MTDYARYVSRLKQLQTDLGDARDVVLTPRAQEEFYGKQAALARTISTLINASDLDEPAAHVADAEEKHAIVLRAQADIERQIEASPDWRTIEDSRSRDREWGRQQDLLASRRAITHGVEYMSGHACVPLALRALLGVVTDANGREMPVWYGSLPEIEQDLARWTSRRQSAQSALDAAVAEAERLLGEPVTS
jgi:hypothetical protein